MRAKSFFIVRVPNVDRQSKASDLQSLLEAPLRDFTTQLSAHTKAFTSPSQLSLQTSCIELLSGILHTLRGKRAC